jgi:hypothetical protein
MPKSHSNDSPVQDTAVEKVYVEDWGVAYGSPYLVDVDPAEDASLATLVEDGGKLLLHTGHAIDPGAPLAFVDGIRRAEAWLYCTDVNGSAARGIAGAFATGAVLARAGESLTFAHECVRRLTIWGSGAHPSLVDVTGGWRWEVVSIATSEPDGPLSSLQDHMREAERELAVTLAQAGYTVLLDGPLNFVVGRSASVVGYVKTHHRAFLPPEQHRLVPMLNVGQRTSLFSIDERYSCYARIAARGPHAGPWSGIVRLHLAGEAGLAAAKQYADGLTALLPAYAGVPHRDARAPQNLQPIGALETRLRHLMGDPRLATRAVRDAVYERELA